MDATTDELVVTDSEGNDVRVALADIAAVTDTDDQNLEDFEVNGTNLDISIQDGNTVSVPLADIAAATDTNTTNTTFTVDTATDELVVTDSEGNDVRVALSDIAAIVDTDTTNAAFTVDTTTDELVVTDSEGNDVRVALADIAAITDTDTDTTNATFSVDTTTDELVVTDSEGNDVRVALADIAAVTDTDTDTTNATFSVDTTTDELVVTDSEGNDVRVALADIAAITDTDTTNATFSVDTTTDELVVTDSEGNDVRIALADIAAVTDTDDQNLEDFEVNGTNLDISIQDGNTVSVPLADIAAATDTDTTNATFAVDTTTDELVVTDSEGNDVRVALSDIAAIVDTDTDTQDLSIDPAGTTISLVDGGSVTVDIDALEVDLNGPVDVDGDSTDETTVQEAIEDLASVVSTTADDDLAVSNTVLGHRIATLNETGGVSNLDINETVTSMSQNTTTGIISYTDEDGGAAQTANVVSGNTGNEITVGTDGGAMFGLNDVDVDGDGTNETTVQEAIEDLASTNQNLATDNLVQDPQPRTYDMNNRDLSFSNGSFGIGTTNPNGTLEVRSTEDHNAFSFIQEDGIFSERDVFTIDDQDIGGGSQDHSSSFKVMKSGSINTSDNGFSLIELANTGTDPGANKYWISGRKTDEGAPLWGVDITDNDFWSEGGITLGATGAADGTYSNGNFRVDSNGDTGIGTTTPDARLDVEGGAVRFTDYAAATTTYENSAADFMLATDAEGDVVQVNTVKSSRVFYPPSIAIDASANGTFTIDLYAQYIAQFGSPVVSSGGTIPTYNANELDYHVTYADPDVFGNGTSVQNMSVNAAGILSYEVFNQPADYNSLINVVFVVK